LGTILAEIEGFDLEGSPLRPSKTARVRPGPSTPAERLEMVPAPAPRLELWHSWLCPHGMRVRTALAEKGLPYRSRMIDHGQRPAAFVGAAVVMMESDRQLIGSMPILEHLETRWPEPALFPAHPGRETVHRILKRLDDAFTGEHARIARGTPIERVLALGATTVFMEELDTEVTDDGFLLGAFSAADLALASHLALLPRDWRPAHLGLRRLGRWERKVMSRPTVRQQMAPVG
jgi:glutathione S-transferase